MQDSTSQYETVIVSMQSLYLKYRSSTTGYVSQYRVLRSVDTIGYTSSVDATEDFISSTTPLVQGTTDESLQYSLFNTEDIIMYPQVLRFTTDRRYVVVSTFVSIPACPYQSFCTGNQVQYHQQNPHGTENILPQVCTTGRSYSSIDSPLLVATPRESKYRLIGTVDRFQYCQVSIFTNRFFSHLSTTRPQLIKVHYCRLLEIDSCRNGEHYINYSSVLITSIASLELCPVLQPMQGHTSHPRLNTAMPVNLPILHRLYRLQRSSLPHLLSPQLQVKSHWHFSVTTTGSFLMCPVSTFVLSVSMESWINDYYCNSKSHIAPRSSIHLTVLLRWIVVCKTALSTSSFREYLEYSLLDRQVIFDETDRRYGEAAQEESLQEHFTILLSLLSSTTNTSSV